MPIFYVDSGSIDKLEVSSSLLVSGSSTIRSTGGDAFVVYATDGNRVMVVSSSAESAYTKIGDIDNVLNGTNLEINAVTETITAGGSFSASDITSLGLLNVSSGGAIITGSVRVRDGITGSLQGTASFATSASFASTASFALNAGGGSGFPFSGIAEITGSIVLSSGSGIFPIVTASEALTAGDFVNMAAGGIRKASSNDTTKQAHGFVTASYNTGNSVVVFYSGLNTGVTGLTVGSRYFLSASGTEATTVPTTAGQLAQEVGVAISPTAILVNFGPAIVT